MCSKLSPSEADLLGFQPKTPYASAWSLHSFNSDALPILGELVRIQSISLGGVRYIEMTGKPEGDSF